MSSTVTPICSRRAFMARAGSCAAHVLLMAASSSAAARRLWAADQERYPSVAVEPWGRLQQVAEGVWALVSTPLEDRTTLCNGGIVSGRNGVLVVEAFASDRGARWLAGEARRLTGRPPTHVVVTHYHGDHTGGLTGAHASADVQLMATERTRALVRERDSGAAAVVLERVRILDTRRPTEIDLGGRSVLVVPRRGHTDSDVTLEVDDPRVVFCGDLVWNGMFPNYVDAAPSRLSLSVRLLRELRAEVYVPGHGGLADRAAMDTYIRLLDHVEEAARSALQRGLDARAAGLEYRVPGELGEWFLFSPGYFERALGAWMSELGAV